MHRHVRSGVGPLNGFSAVAETGGRRRGITGCYYSPEPPEAAATGALAVMEALV